MCPYDRYYTDPRCDRLPEDSKTRFPLSYRKADSNELALAAARQSCLEELNSK